ncbi:DUF87 domain-containing protein [Oscillatoria laete-virens NRMC-F 0139]|nr:DUF87 domain-containing protein [Oscillatoria laete-virens]MDL5055641.1 DUF87 domain-containing protein [Oscillatoria laete-virens NRMC-F 0139]
MPFIEAPTSFYLGRAYDPQAGRITDDVVYYDSRDLTTHAVVVGMTGSGKTGLCISLLEEAILDNIPAIIIDPKGDITNLLLHFPDLTPEQFRPWINIDDARKAGLSEDQFAADQAHTWREGLASWGIVPDRLRWLQVATQYSIYTPGSDAGLPISILASLRAPREGWVGNEEAMRERISGLTTALLALTGRNAQPVQDKEHVLIANIFEHAWQRGIDLTLEDIIIQVQRPPFSKLGVFPLDDYISERVRMKLAMDLNSIVAAPSFQSWINGDPMDIHNLLYRPDGRPRVSIFYINHLSEPERQFIITLLMENVNAWMRTLSGTTSLRALIYIDEMYGYFPPHPRNPPTKEPILRLLKQARAFGVGLILATQNPGDLDYKGLNNAGTWFIGRLQTDNDKKRVMAGLEALASVDNELNTRAAERMIADIAPRVFLMHNVHDPGGPVLLHTRWAMNYLRGPLTRQQVGVLMQNQRMQLLARTGQISPAPPGSTPLPAGGTEVMGGHSFAAQNALYAQQMIAAMQGQQQIGYAPIPDASRFRAAPQPASKCRQALPEFPQQFGAQNLPPAAPSESRPLNYSGPTTPPPANFNAPRGSNSQMTALGIQPPAGYSTNHATPARQHGAVLSADRHQQRSGAAHMGAAHRLRGGGIWRRCLGLSPDPAGAGIGAFPGSQDAALYHAHVCLSCTRSRPIGHRPLGRISLSTDRSAPPVRRAVWRSDLWRFAQRADRSAPPDDAAPRAGGYALHDSCHQGSVQLNTGRLRQPGQRFQPFPGTG